MVRHAQTGAPYLMTKHRAGARIGHDTMFDHMYLDGLEDAYEPGRLMGSFAEESARSYQLTREGFDLEVAQTAAEALERVSSLPTRACNAGTYAAAAIVQGRLDELLPHTWATAGEQAAQ